MSHLRETVLQAFTRSLPIADGGVLLHLLTCTDCAAKAVAALGFPPARRLPAADERTEAYSGVIERLGARLASLHAAAPAERAQARAAVEQALVDGSALEILAERVASDPSYKHWPLAWELRAAAAGHLAVDPGHAEKLAVLALTLSAALAAEDDASAAGFRCAVWVELAAARRAQGDLATAGEAMREAHRYLRQAADPDERASFCRELAELRRREGRFEEALALYERAAGLFEDYGQLDGQAAAWLAAGDLHLGLGDPEKALELFDSVGLLAEEDAGFVLQAAIGAATALLAQGLAGKAREALRAVSERSDLRADLDRRAEVDWIEGRIAACSGSVEVAESRLWCAYSSFLERKQPLRAALIALDLAELAAAGKDGPAVERLVGALESLAADTGLPAEVRAALADLIGAATSGRPILPLTAALAGFLERFRT